MKKLKQICKCPECGKIVSAIERRIRYFNERYHSYEAQELTYALKSIQRLIPPEMFQIGHFEFSSTQPEGEGMAEALRLKWINLTEDMGRLLSGQRGVSIDKLNKAMNLVQEFVNTLPASLSSPGSGWVKVEDGLPEVLETVWISNGKGWTTLGCRSDYQQGDDGELIWCWCATNGTIYEEDGKIVAECEEDDWDVRHWRPLPAPPGE